MLEACIDDLYYELTIFHDYHDLPYDVHLYYALSSHHHLNLILFYRVRLI